MNFWPFTKLQTMKRFYKILIAIYSLVAIYFIYMSAITLFVFFSNKAMGLLASFFEPGKNIILATLFSFFAIVSRQLLIKPTFRKLGLVIFYLPIVISLLFLLWVIIIIIAAGGKWN
jgi:hypothetical protein